MFAIFEISYRILPNSEKREKMKNMIEIKDR